MLLAQPRASCRSVIELVLDSPMEIALEIARLVLEMRDNGRKAGVNKQRLELLAETFLRITGQGTQSDSVPRIAMRSGDPIRVN